MKIIKKKIIQYYWMTMAIIFMICTPAMAQKVGKSDKKQSVKKEYKTKKTPAGPSATNKQARAEIKSSQEKEMKKIKGEGTNKEKENKEIVKPKYKKTVKRKGKSIEKKPLQ